MRFPEMTLRIYSKSVSENGKQVSSIAENRGEEFTSQMAKSSISHLATISGGRSAWACPADGFGVVMDGYAWRLSISSMIASK